MRWAILFGRVGAALFALLNAIETIQGAPQAVNALSEVGVAHPQTLGIVLSAIVVLILGLVALGPERVRRGWNAVFGNSHLAQRRALPLLDRLWLRVDEAKALAEQMHEIAPGATLKPARAWRGEVYTMLLGEQPGWAQEFRAGTQEIPQMTDQIAFPARAVFEHQIQGLEDILHNKHH